MIDHDPGDEDRRPVVTGMLDVCGLVDSFCSRRPIWELTHSDRHLVGAVLRENDDLRRTR